LKSSRKLLLRWAEQGHLPHESIEAALRFVGAEPSASDWRRFLDGLMLWCGSLFLAAGVIFFFAFNWAEMGRYTKFGLVEALLVAAVATSWKLGLDRLSGKAALLIAALLVGALLALVGQTYQTGADPWQLFAVWAVMILPWVAIGRFSGLLLFWVALVNLSLLLYFQTFPRFFGLIGLLFSPETLLWSFFLFNTIILFCWEAAARCRVKWLTERWSVRVLAVASGGLITALAIWSILDFRAVGFYALLVHAIWLAAAYFYYRCRFMDLFVLAGGVLSVIIVVATGLSRLLLSHGDSAFALLVIGMAVIGMSAAGGLWLKAIAVEERL
jgi:uncharacterized membrane protein